MEEGVSRNGASLSEGLLAEEVEGGPLYWGPWKIFHGSGYGVLSPRGPFTSEGNLESGGGD
jgi:hypothetical protein